MRVVLTLLLIAAAAPAWADWVRVAESDMAVHYVDPATIRTDGNRRTVWELADLKKKGTFGEASNRTLGEFDCQRRRSRIHEISGYSEPMAGGRALFSIHNHDSWAEVAPGSRADTVFRIVCAP